MKITAATLASVCINLPSAFAADPEDLYTRVTPPSDPSPATLIANGTVVWGEQFSNNTVVGSQIVVNDANLELETGAPGPVSSISGVHVPIHSRRTDTADITRWYQQDGRVQIFRLFQGENNYRYDVPAEAPPSRVEAVSPTLAVAPGTWRVWEATYTIVDPLASNIFQLFHTGSDLWSFHFRMSDTGTITFNRRSSIPGLPDNITIAENMVGKSLALRVRANGYNYEVYKKVPFVDANWVLVTIGEYQQSPTDEVIFRWGMYPGSQPGTTSSNGLLFVSGAATSVSSTPAVPPPVTYYWDNNGTSPGFGTAAGTWAAPTTGSATQGWSIDDTGATLPPNVTTRTFDTVHFGVGATGLAAGTITVSGAVTSGNMSFASGTGALTLNGGSISVPPETTLTLAGSALRTINSVIGGATDGFMVAGTGTLVLNGLNTFSGPVIIGDNTDTVIVRINSLANHGVGASPSSLGAPTSATKGLIQLGSGSRSSTLEFIGASAASSTNRQIRIGSDSNGSGTATIVNNDADAADTLTFSNAVFNAAAPAVSSSFGRTLTLGGSNTGNNTISGAIVDNGSSKVGLNKSGTGTWILSGASSYSGNTNINAGTLKAGVNNALPNGTGKSAVTVNGGASTSARGILDLNGFSLAINGLGGSTGTELGRVVNNATGTNRTLTVGNNNATSTFNGIIANNTSGTGTVALTKVGSGTQTLAGPNTYTGATTISGGTLALGANNVLPDSTALSIGNATLNAATFDDTIGTLDAAGAATINLGAGANLAFANSSSVDWTGGTLILTGTFVSGSSLRFGTTSSGLTPAQLSLISVPGFGPASLNSSGYLTAAAGNLPILVGSNIVDDRSGGPVGIGWLVTYTLTFSKDMNAATVDASDFGNAGTSSFSIGTITETSPGVFTVPVTPTSGGNLRLRINAGAVLNDISGSALDTTSAIIDDTTLLIESTPPTLIGGDIVDDKNAGPVRSGTLVSYTLTFSEEMDAATVDATDFGNAGTAAVTIGTISETSPGVFTVEVTPTTTGTLVFRINEGAVMKDLFGNALDTTPAIADDSTLAVLGPDAYWDIDGPVAGAGGAVPTGTWNATNALWNTVADGTGTAYEWVPGQTAIFAAGSNATGAYTVNLDGTLDIGGLTVEEGSPTLVGETGLRLTGNTVMNVAAGLSATVATPISEDASPRSLSKSGSGTLVLGEVNTYSGATSINQGTLLVDTGGTLGDSGKSLTLGSGVAGMQTADSVGNLTLNASTQVSSITLKSNTSNTTTAGNIGLLSIANGRTVTASSFTAGIIAASQDTHTALATGAAGTGGSLTVNGNTTIGVAGSTTNIANVSVNLSGLDAFSVNSAGGTLNVGSALNSRATLALAENSNTINVATLGVGNTTSNYNLSDLSTLSLGPGSNSLQATNIILGQGKGNGRMIFSDAGGSVTITGLNGSGTSNITIGNHTTATYAGGGTSSLSLAGHHAIISAGTVTIGQKSGSAASGALPASLTFDTGSFAANTVQMAVASAGSSSLTSTFTVGGPAADSAATGVVTIGGNLLLAAATGGTATPASTLAIHGGTVNVNSTTPTPGEGIFDTSTAGASTTTLTLAGGTLDLNGGTIGGTSGTGRRNITQLNFRSGTLRNVFQINDGSGLTKTTAGTLTLAGINSYSGGTTITDGTLVLGSSNSLPDNTPVSIGAATLDAATFTNTTGTLDVTAAATINLGAGSALAFANSSGIGGGVWAGTLNITGAFVSGSSVRFGSSATALTNAQLLKISAPGFFNFLLNADGYLIATPGGYSSWASLNGAGADVAGDHDQDGVSNGVEYFLGGPAGNTTGFTPLPSVVNTLGTLSVTWTKATSFTGTYGTHFVVEASSNLSGPWTPQTLSPEPGSTVTISGNEVKYTFPTGAKNFARLKVMP